MVPLFTRISNSDEETSSSITTNCGWDFMPIELRNGLEEGISAAILHLACFPHDTSAWKNKFHAGALTTEQGGRCGCGHLNIPSFAACLHLCTFRKTRTLSCFFENPHG